MSFTPNIPASGQTLGSSRLQVLNNFASLRSTISNTMQPNHIDVNNSGAGKHIFLQMPVQVAGAANLPAAGEGGMITETVSGASELFYVRDAVATYFQMTGPFNKTIGPPNQGSIFLFGGLIMKWGLAPNVGGTINFVTPFPNNCFGVVVTAQENAQFQFGVYNISTTGFNINGTGGAAHAWFYIALGD